MIRNKSYELLDKTRLSTDILLKFEDKKINKDGYYSIKDRVEDFKLDNESEYSITMDSRYDYSREVLLIEIILSIPDRNKPSGVNLEQIINELSYKFIDYYEKLSY